MQSFTNTSVAKDIEIYQNASGTSIKRFGIQTEPIYFETELTTEYEFKIVDLSIPRFAPDVVVYVNTSFSNGTEQIKGYIVGSTGRFSSSYDHVEPCARILADGVFSSVSNRNTNGLFSITVNQDFKGFPPNTVPFGVDLTSIRFIPAFAWFNSYGIQDTFGLEDRREDGRWIIKGFQPGSSYIFRNYRLGMYVDQIAAGSIPFEGDKVKYDNKLLCLITSSIGNNFRMVANTNIFQKVILRSEPAGIGFKYYFNILFDFLPSSRSDMYNRERFQFVRSGASVETIRTVVNYTLQMRPAS